MYTVIRNYRATLQRVKWFLRLKRPDVQFEPAARASVPVQAQDFTGATVLGTRVLLKDWN